MVVVDGRFAISGFRYWPRSICATAGVLRFSVSLTGALRVLVPLSVEAQVLQNRLLAYLVQEELIPFRLFILVLPR